MAPRPATPHPHTAVPGWLGVRLPVGPSLFLGQRHRLELRCQAAIADLPPKDVSVTAHLRDLPAPGNQRLASSAAPAHGPAGTLSISNPCPFDVEFGYLQSNGLV